MPVLSNEDNRLLGIVTISDLVKLYDKEVEKILKIKKDNGSEISSLENKLSSSDADPTQEPSKP